MSCASTRRELPSEHFLAVLASEGVVRLRRLADEGPELGEVPGAVRDGDQPAARTKHAVELRDRPVDVGNVVEHPGGDGCVEAPILERKLLDVADCGLDPARRASARPCAADWSTATTVGPELTRHTLGQLALARPDLQHAGRLDLASRPRATTSCASGPVALLHTDWRTLEAQTRPRTPAGRAQDR